MLLHVTVLLENGSICSFLQAIDDDCNQTGQMLAALLEWPQVISELRSVGHFLGKL